MPYARIVNGIVAELITIPTGLLIKDSEASTERLATLADLYRPEIVAALVSCASDVAEGWAYDGTSFAAPVVPAISPPIPQTLTREQFFMQAAIDGDITQDEAIAAMSFVTPPPLVALIAALPANQQFAANMAVRRSTFDRSAPLVASFGAAMGKSPAALDAFWVAGAAL